MKRTKLLSYATMITLLAPAMIGVHQAYADTTTSTKMETEEAIETTATTESSSMESTTETVQEQTEESSSVNEDLNPIVTESEEQVNTDTLQEVKEAPKSELASTGDFFDQTYLAMFPDEKLRKVVMEKTGASFEDELVNKRSVELFFRLDGNLSGIKNLEGIQNLYNLKWVNLSGNSIEDITPLGQLENLELLTLSRNNIKDFTPLNNCKNLIDLEINNIPGLTNLESLAGITSLQVLWADDNPTLTDISSISSLVNLSEVVIQGSKVTDITPLATLPNLKKYSIISFIEMEEQTALDGYLEVPLNVVKAVDIDGTGLPEHHNEQDNFDNFGLKFKEFSNGSFKWDNVSNTEAVYLTYHTPDTDLYTKFFNVCYKIPVKNTISETPDSSTPESSATDESSSKDSGTKESTTPSVQDTTTTTSSQPKTDKVVATPSSNTQSTESSAAGSTKNLPETGTANNGLLTALGIGVISLVAVWFSFKKKARKQ